MTEKKNERKETERRKEPDERKTWQIKLALDIEKIYMERQKVTLNKRRNRRQTDMEKHTGKTKEYKKKMDR